MNPPHLLPSRPLKWAAAWLRVLLWVLLGAWLLVGLTLGAIHGIIVPRIAEWRPALETLASRTIGVPVRIGRIEASTRGWIPSFELTDVSLLDNQGREALVLGRVLTAVSVPSLWRLGFEQIYIDSPTLDVRRLPTGELEIAGIKVSNNSEQTNQDSQALDWFFSQTEFVIRSGQVRWTDDLNQQPTLSLTDVDLVVRNRGRQHRMRLDATPADGLSGRIALRAEMRSPFLTLHPGRTADWRGTAYVHWPGAQLARLASPAQLNRWLNLSVTQGEGALRVWADVSAGQLDQLTADLALTHVNARFAHAPQALALDEFNGRVTVARTATGWDLSTGPVAFATPDGQRWQHGRLRLQASPPEGDRPLPGSLEASDISLGALHALGDGLPLPAQLHTWLAQLQPQGHIDTLRLNWTGNAAGWTRYKASGGVSGLALASAASETIEPATANTARTGGTAHAAAHGKTPPHRAGRPGVSGASVTFDLDQDGGKAQLALAQGQLSFPGIFEEPDLPIDTLSAELNWRTQGSDVQVQFNRLKFANADLQGQASGTWRTSDPAHAASGGRFPGVLKLDGVLTHGQAERIHRYLPLVIAPEARAYIKAAVLGGQARDVRFHVAGDLWHMPFENPKDGEFRVALRVTGLEYAFAPLGGQAAGSLPWPALHQLEGELVFDRDSLTVNAKKAAAVGFAGLRLGPTRARIAHLGSQAVVEVNAQLDGPLTDLLGVVNRSPLGAMTQQALAQASATGNGSVQFNLAVPLARLDQTTVKGTVTLAGNDLQINPDTPLLARTRGRVAFDERGFQVAQASTRMAGGELQFSGGTVAPPTGGLLFKGQGVATAEGLRQLPQLSALAALTRHGSGTAAYTTQLALGGLGPDLSIQSTTQGLALSLPTPLQKPALVAWPLSYRLHTPSADTERQTLSWDSPQGPVLWFALGRSLARPGEALQGRVVVGTAARPSTPPTHPGLSLHVATARLDADDWEAALRAPPPAGATAATAATAAAPAFDPSSLPQRVSLDADTLALGSREFHRVALDLQRQGSRWSGRVQAQELAGQVELQPAQGEQEAQLKARLERLTLVNTEDPHTGRTGTTAPPAEDTTRQLPSLDVQVQSLDIDGRSLGQLDLLASNRQSGAGLREWRLSRLRLSVPEAELNAQGNWAPMGTGSAASAGLGPRRTVLKFKLDIKDSGALLTRMGMPHVFQGGHGQLEGTLGWLGAPHALHTPSLSGQLKLNVADGRFLKADPGLAKLLGVLSLQSLPRRLALDFRDVFAQGFAFDFARGDARIDQGIVFTNNLQLKGPTAAVLLEGQADTGTETQDIRAVVVPELNTGTAALIATVINPAVGLGTFLAQTLLRQPLAQASTREFRIQGTWADPVVTRTDGHSAPPASTPTAAPITATAPTVPSPPTFPTPLAPAAAE